MCSEMFQELYSSLSNSVIEGLIWIVFFISVIYIKFQKQKQHYSKITSSGIFFQLLCTKNWFSPNTAQNKKNIYISFYKEFSEHFEEKFSALCIHNSNS